MKLTLRTIIMACLGIITFKSELKAQNAPITFEPAGFGNAWTWNTFENGPNAAIQMVANPNPSGVNTTSTVASITALQIGAPYVGFESIHPGSFVPGASALGTFTLNATNSTVKIMVYKSVISDVGIKFATASNASTGEIKVANTLINQWEELTFNFDSKIGEPASTDIDQIIIFPDFQSRTSDNVCYIDNISFSASTAPPTSPTIAAPTPTVPASNVISLFSNAYTNVAIDTWLTSWSAASLTDLLVAGNDTKKYSSLDYAGIEFTGANLINANTMTHFHLDAWTPNLTTFKIKLVDFGANAVFAGGDDVEHELSFTPTLNGWNTYDIPLSDFTGLTTKAHLAQMILVGVPTGSGIVYVDNVYFYSPVVNTFNAPITFEPGGNGNAWSWSTFENGPNAPIQMVANPSITGVNPSATVASITALQIGMPWAGFESIHPGSVPPGASALGTFTLNATNSTVKMMVYKSVISDVGIKFATASNASTGEIKVANTLINQWEELTFNFDSKIGEPSSTDIDQIIIFPDFQSRTSDNICYIDNISFSASTAPPSAPTVAAPTPTRPAANVISLFSNAYTNTAVDTWLTGWSAGSLTDLQIAGNDAKKYASLDFVGIEFTGANLIDASSMQFFHLDAWTPNMTTFRIKLVDFGANGVFQGGDDVEHELSFTPTLSGWNSYEIPLSSFTGLLTRAHLAQLIFSGNPAGSGIVYVDNVYFHNVTLEPIVAAPTPTALPANVISMFSNAYTNVPIDTWQTGWSNATLTDLLVAGNDTKRYTLLDFVGIESVGPNLIDATAMTTFNFDLWTPNITTFRVKLVDFGANGVYQGGDDVEHELTFTPTISGWNSYHIPLSNFTNLVTRGHIAQLIFSCIPVGAGTAFIDNVYFSQPPTQTNLSITCFIEGYWNGVNAMLPVLLNQAQPNTSTQCDSISIGLISAATVALGAPYTPDYVTNAVLNTNGTASAVFANAVSGNYYIVLKHRNAIETWSASLMAFPATTGYNFSTAASQAYGANQKEVATGIWALYSGDVAIDENIDLLDLGLVETDINAFSFGYLPTDINGDGNVDLLDSPVLEVNTNSFIFSQHP
jgi:hypothetical protein